MERYRVDSGLAVPIYQQLVDAVRSDIKRGALAPGEQLPTVQRMAQSLGMAQGTVKRAYDQLEQLGLLEKIQGRGTFVRHQPAPSTSRKEQAVAAIDTLLDQLTAMGLSAGEIRIFLDLKLRERAERLAPVKVGVVAECPEVLRQLTEHLRKIGGVELYAYLLSAIQAYPYQLEEELDLVVSAARHLPFLETAVPDRKKIAGIALRLSLPAAARLARLPAGASLGILSCSEAFGQLLYDACGLYAQQAETAPPQLLSPQLDCARFLRGKAAVLLPEDVSAQAGEETLRQLEQFGRSGQLIPCVFELDEGSCLSLQEKIGRLREEKSI